MELHKALRNIIQTDGPEILKEVRLVNILDDFQAYQDIPASKYILRAIIVDGYSSKLLAIGRWNREAEALANKFSSVTGFIPESVTLIFQSISYGIGWTTNNPENHLSKTKNPNQHSAQNKPTSTTPLPRRKSIQTQWRNNMTEDEIDAYFLSITELDSSNDQVFGASIENLCYFISSNDNLTLSCEVKRINKKKDYAFLRYTLYDTKRRAVSTGYGTGKAPNTPNPNPVLLEFDLPPKMISKIRLYWE